MSKVFNKNLIVAVMALAFAPSVNVVSANDNCESTYGGGETCIYNKAIIIEKKVKFEDSDKKPVETLEDVEKGEVVEFIITVSNGEDSFELDNMKMEDFLPDDMERVGGSGLTEYWDNFEPDSEKEFKIKAKVKDEMFEDADFERICTVNTAEVRWDGTLEGSDAATVCYTTEERDEDEEITELPETGPAATAGMAVSGLGLVVTGTLIKKRKLA